MKKFFMLGATMAVIVIGAAASVMAQRPAGPDGTGGQRPLARLNLTGDQRAQLRELITQARDQAAPIVAELRDAQRELREQSLAATRDEARIAELTAKVAALRGQVNEIRLKARTSAAGILTPDQRDSVRAMPKRPLLDFLRRRSQARRLGQVAS
jgi:Spy/CpxP family protein refolding chaperone